MKSDWIWFLRPTLGVVICYCIAIAVSYSLSQDNMDALDQELLVVEQFADRLEEIEKPHPNLTPKQVVEIQTSALQDPNKRLGALRCMYFASPDNLSITGPLDRFAKMLRGPRFAVLSAPDALLIGDPTFQGRNARILVTAISAEQVNAFVWVLSKQEGSPYQDCWMTEGVFSVFAPQSSDSEI